MAISAAETKVLKASRRRRKTLAVSKLMTYSKKK